jgi:hypothetical protein
MLGVPKQSIHVLKCNSKVKRRKKVKETSCKIGAGIKGPADTKN